MKRFEASLLLALCISLCWGIRVAAQQKKLQDNIVRLHVVAVSDDAQEQAVKLRVRDSVLDYLAGFDSLPDSLEGIKNAALAQSGGRSVYVTLENENFPARTGDGYSLPAGRYRTLRVTIGDGAGHNWWGIIFPRFMGGTQEEIMEAADIIGSENLKLITGGDEKYEVRFKILELFQRLGK